MKTLLCEIIEILRTGDRIDNARLAKLIRAHNANMPPDKHYAKKKLLPYYQKIKNNDPRQWESWNIDPQLEKLLVQTLQVKPRRTASGVATITVITKPWACSSNCLYCPHDIRMPKSYLHNEPACQRAERNYFDPYLQVTSRLRALTHMGHTTDKIELIVLGGTWSDYPLAYQIWFITELFRALNDETQAEAQAKTRRAYYHDQHLVSDSADLKTLTASLQNAVNRGEITYNQAVKQLYGSKPWSTLDSFQTASFEELERVQRTNEQALHRVVGLVIETRPDTIDASNLTIIRRLGCTKIQMGIQSIDSDILRANKRTTSLDTIQKAFELTRLFGFKIHAHFMINLFQATPESDKHDYHRFVTEAPWQPDEIKLYPCALIEGTQLCTYYHQGLWHPYTEEELLDVLVYATLITPPFIRVSRMIRDFSACDIVEGNKKGNLRQLVEQEAVRAPRTIEEIRFREINTHEACPDNLSLSFITYETTATQEHFIQWITPENRIAGFLRLSLPYPAALTRYQHQLPFQPHEAMIREVHIYGKVAKLHTTGQGAQHLGLGKRLIQEACRIAKENGFEKINVISAVGTREYYRSLGFCDTGLYQQKTTA